MARGKKRERHSQTLPKSFFKLQMALSFPRSVRVCEMFKNLSLPLSFFMFGGRNVKAISCWAEGKKCERGGTRPLLTHGPRQMFMLPGQKALWVPVERN